MAVAVVAAAPAVMRRTAISPSAAENPATLSHISTDATAADGGREPREDADAHPPGRQGVEADELAPDHQQVEQHREVDAVEEPERHEEAPRRLGEQRHARVELQHDDGEERRTKRAGEQRVGQHPEEPHHSKCILRVVPCDIDAAVRSNTRLSDEYSVLALDAPEIAGLARPGQFVMVKPSRSSDPLLRRPFSIFEILRDANDQPTGISILNKRIGVGTRLIYDAEPGSRVACLGPARPAVRAGRSRRRRPGWWRAASDSRRS